MTTDSRMKLSAVPRGRVIFCVPADRLLELLPRQEAVVLPELPQGALELLLVLVLGSLHLPLLLGVPSPLAVVQPADEAHDAGGHEVTGGPVTAAFQGHP